MPRRNGPHAVVVRVLMPPSYTWSHVRPWLMMITCPARAVISATNHQAHGLQLFYARCPLYNWPCCVARISSGPANSCRRRVGRERIHASVWRGPESALTSWFLSLGVACCGRASCAEDGGGHRRPPSRLDRCGSARSPTKAFRTPVAGTMAAERPAGAQPETPIPREGPGAMSSSPATLRCVLLPWE